MSDVFVNWKSWETLPDQSKNYVIFYREMKYINSYNIDTYQEKIDGVLLAIGDTLIKNEAGRWVHHSKKEFKEKFESIN